MKIIQILVSYKEDLNDIPYIITYQRNLYEPELEPIWKIFDYDQEWNKLFEMKQNLKRSFDTVRKVSINDQKKADLIYERYIENAKSINELQDIEVYIEFLKDLHFEEFTYLNEESKILRPNKSSQIQNFQRQKIDEYARKFSITAYDLSMNLENLAIGDEENMILPNCPEIQPEKLALDYICPLYESDIKVMTSGCKFLALELFSFPFIRNYARISFKSQCTISTDPTEEGKKELDAFHPSFRVKRIKNKPIDTFNNDLFLDILEAEKKNWITVKVQYGDNFFKDLTEKLNLTYNSKYQNSELDSIQHGWRVMREETLRIFVADHCIPYFRKEVRLDLQEKAENFIIDECAMNFSKLLLTGPYKKKKEPNEFIGDDYLFKEEEYPRVFSLIYDNAKNEVYSAMLDENGDIMECMKFSSLMIKSSKMLNKEEKEVRIEEDEKCKMIIQQMKPDLIVIGANDLKCKYLKDYIQSCDENMQSRIWTTFGDPTIPRITAACPRVEKLNKDLNFFYKTAISLGRFKQNPIAEILQLWHEEINKNFCLSIPLHPLMRSVNQIKLVEALENEAVRIVNFIGLDLNKTCEFSHLNSPLQFISGLGPRKSKDLIDRIISKGFIENRATLIEDSKLLRKKVFTNCASFLRIKRTKNENIYDLDPLDSTRIHPENYPLAYKVAKATLDENVSANFPQKEAVKNVLRDPRKLECLDLQEYIKKSYEKGNKNIEMQINFIKSEFQKPFFFDRIHKDLQPSEIFHLFLNDPTFCRGQLVHATVLKVDEHHVKCRLTNDLEATIWVNDLFDEERPEDKKTDEMKIFEMKQRFKEGMVIDGRVKSIDEHKFKIDLTLKQSELESVKNYYLVRGHDKYFEINEDEDLKISSFSKEKKAQTNKYQVRNIQYNHFKNINFKASLDYLRNKEIGAFIYRPSSKGESYLNLSWKFYNETFQHVEIVEEDKTTVKSIGNRLRIGNEYYRSLNEITERYLKPCEMIVKDVIENRKFINCENAEDFQMKICKDEKTSNMNFFIYQFTILSDYPGFILLGYSLKPGNFTREFIRVRPRGLFFHNENFSNLEDLASYFKKNFGNESYREFVKKMKAPQIEENKNINLHDNDNEFSVNNDGISIISSAQSNFDRDRFSESGNRSFRERNINRGNKTCHNCGQYGHFVSDCPTKNSSNFKRGLPNDFNSRNNKFKDDREFLSNKRTRSPNSNSDFPQFNSNRQQKPEEKSWGNNSNNEFPQDLNNNNNIKINENNSNNNWGISSSTKENWNTDSNSKEKNEDDWGMSNYKSEENCDTNSNKNSDTWKSNTNNENTNWDNNKNRQNSNRDNNNNNNSRFCYNCNEENHVKANCPKLSKDNFNKIKTCHKCSQEGHLSYNCPNNSNNNSFNNRGNNNNNTGEFKRPGGCFNCGENGHIANSCPNPRRPNNFQRNREGNNPSNFRRDSYHNRGNNNRFNRDFSNEEKISPQREVKNEENTSKNSNWSEFADNDKENSNKDDKQNLKEETGNFESWGNNDNKENKENKENDNNEW